MKRLVLVALLCVLLGAVAFAETEDEARAALQNTLMELEETYGAELLPEEQMQLSFLIDWADRYVESEQWAQFAEDFGQCQDAQKLSELLNTDYMGINQAEEGLMQREEKLRSRGLHERADKVRLVIDRLYTLRDELIRILEKQRLEQTAVV